MRPRPRYSASECSEQLETTLRHHHLRVINAKIRRNTIGFKNAIAKANFPRCANCFGLRASFTLGAIPPLFGYMLSEPICVISGKCSFLPRISRIFTDLVTCYPCSFVSSVGNIFPPTDFTDFHRFGYMLSVFICGISGNIFPPTDFTDLHGFGYMLSVFICVISGECSFLPRISRIFTDLVTCYPCSFVLSVGNVLFSHGFHRFARI